MARDTTPEEPTTDVGRAADTGEPTGGGEGRPPADDSVGPLAELLSSSPVSAITEPDEPGEPGESSEVVHDGPAAERSGGLGAFWPEATPSAPEVDPSELVSEITTSATVDVAIGSLFETPSMAGTDDQWPSVRRESSALSGLDEISPPSMGLIRSPGQPRSASLPRFLRDLVDRREVWATVAVWGMAAAAVIGFAAFTVGDDQPQIEARPGGPTRAGGTTPPPTTPVSRPTFTIDTSALAERATTAGEPTTTAERAPVTRARRRAAAPAPPQPVATASPAGSATGPPIGDPADPTATTDPTDPTATTDPTGSTATTGPTTSSSVTTTDSATSTTAPSTTGPTSGSTTTSSTATTTTTDSTTPSSVTTPTTTPTTPTSGSSTTKPSTPPDDTTSGSG